MLGLMQDRPLSLPHVFRRGVADTKWGERPVAYVVPRPGATLTAETVRDHVRARVASWWLPDQVLFLDEIPKTATGKFSKQRLRSLYVTDDH